MMSNESITALVRQQVPPAVWDWLQVSANLVKAEQGAAELNKAFAFVPRKTGTAPIASLRDWTIDRLSRVWLLLQVDHSGKDAYLAKIEPLFSAASMNESVALYSALPLLSFPSEWRGRCAEGIRSNIGTVLEAIMYENEYPALWLEEPAWNQLILKAFFTEKDTGRITGIDQRANRPLANVLFDYAHERWAAGRDVNPRLWRLTGPFLDAQNFGDIAKLFGTGSAVEKKAALLACFQSDYPPAQSLLDGQPAVKKDIVEGRLRWDNLEQTT